MKTNSLVYKVSKDIKNAGKYEYNRIEVNIKLDDKCKNGHQYFAITADCIDTTKTCNDRYICGGCLHDDVIKHFPQLKIFVDLHLCDYDGVPMYPTANLLYHIKKGENPENICKWYRITKKELQEIKKSENEHECYYFLEKLGYVKRWKEDAKKAIEFLESLTGKTFLNDSKKSNFYNVPDSETLQKIAENEKNGYFLAKNVNKRKKEKAKLAHEKRILELNEKEKKAIDNIRKKYAVEKSMVCIFKKLNIEYKNCTYFYYDHKNAIVFNVFDFVSKLLK